jgi:hypothetical protein
VADLFGASSVQRDPTDIELVREVTVQQISDWLMSLIGGLHGLPDDVLRAVKRLQDLDYLKNGLSPIFMEMQDGGHHLVGPKPLSRHVDWS